MLKIPSTPKFFYLITLLWPTTLLALGAWWLYLLHKLTVRLQYFETRPLAINWPRMIKWEGGLFFLLLIIATIVFIWVYIQSYKKTLGLQVFLASITHDLKTPLACIRLQAEILNEALIPEGNAKQLALSENLITDTHKLEYEFNKLLEFSRIQFSQSIILQSIPAIEFCSSIIKDFPELEFIFDNDVRSVKSKILAQPQCLEIVLRNMISNTIKHSKSKRIKINLIHKNQYIHLVYEEEGQAFKGEIKKLGHLFESNNGQGIGLYLTKHLMSQMKGKILFGVNPGLMITLCFLKGH